MKPVQCAEPRGSERDLVSPARYFAVCRGVQRAALDRATPTVGQGLRNRPVGHARYSVGQAATRPPASPVERSPPGTVPVSLPVGHAGTPGSSCRRKPSLRRASGWAGLRISSPPVARDRVVGGAVALRLWPQLRADRHPRTNLTLQANLRFQTNLRRQACVNLYGNR